LVTKLVNNINYQGFNLDSHNNNHIFITFLRIVVHFSIIMLIIIVTRINNSVNNNRCKLP